MSVVMFPTISQRLTQVFSDEERPINRSIASFKQHLLHTSTVCLSNHTGEQEVKLLSSGDRGFSFELNGQKHAIKYPRAGYMKLTNPGTLQLLDGFNGKVTMECRVSTYTDGSKAPVFTDFPDEEEDYGRRKGKRNTKTA